MEQPKIFRGRYCKFCGRELRRNSEQEMPKGYCKRESFSHYQTRSYCNLQCRKMIPRNPLCHSFNSYEYDIRVLEWEQDFSLELLFERALNDFWQTNYSSDYKQNIVYMTDQIMIEIGDIEHIEKYLEYVRNCC